MGLIKAIRSDSTKASTKMREDSRQEKKMKKNKKGGWEVPLLMLCPFYMKTKMLVMKSSVMSGIALTFQGVSQAVCFLLH